MTLSAAMRRISIPGWNGVGKLCPGAACFAVMSGEQAHDASLIFVKIFALGAKQTGKAKFVCRGSRIVVRGAALARTVPWTMAALMWFEEQV